MSMLIKQCRRIARQMLDSQQACRRHWMCRWRRRRITNMLARNREHRFYDDEMLFERLQMRYRGQGEYGYDAFASFTRGAERTGRLIERVGFQEPGRKILDVGCGDGMMGVVLEAYGHHVTLSDVEDWRDPRSKGIPFVGTSAERLDATADHGPFDLVCSYNAFEHFEDPAVVLGHAVAMLKPGGFFYAEFGPLYAGAWGLHAYRSLHMPYPQFLFSPAFIDDKLRAIGIRDLGKDCDVLQPMNQWRLKQFSRIWRESGCEIDHYETGIDERFLDLILRYRHAFAGLDLTYEDLTTKHIAVTLKKPAV